METSEIFIR